MIDSQHDEEASTKTGRQPNYYARLYSSIKNKMDFKASVF